MWGKIVNVERQEAEQENRLDFESVRLIIPRIKLVVCGIVPQRFLNGIRRGTF